MCSYDFKIWQEKERVIHTRVRLHVLNQPALLRESLIAHWTRMWLFSGVRQNMCLQVRLLWESEEMVRCQFILNFNFCVIVFSLVIKICNLFHNKALIFPLCECKMWLANLIAFSLFTTFVLLLITFMFTLKKNKNLYHRKLYYGRRHCILVFFFKTFVRNK